MDQKYMFKAAVLDDYQNVASRMANWHAHPGNISLIQFWRANC
jgi:hypothetical protein